MKDFRPCFKGLFSLLRPVLFKVSGVSLIYLMEAACSLLFVWYSKRVVDIATGALDEGLTGSVIVLVGIMFFQIIFRVLSKRMEGDICVKAKLSIQKSSFNKAMRSTWNGKDKFHSADVVNRLEEDIRVVSEFLCVTLPSAVVTVFQLVASCVLLFSFSSDLAMILIWIMPVAIVASRLYFKKLRSLSLEIRTLDGRIQGYIQEHLQSRILIKTLGAEHLVDSKLERLQNEQIKKTRSRLNYSAVSRFFMQAGFSAGYLTAFLWGVYGLKDGSVSYGLMVAFLQLVGQVQRPVAALASYVPAFIRALSSQERLMDIDEMVGEDTSESKVLPGILSISVRNLNFSYEDGTSVFRDFSCDFAAGELTAICGETGKGKSTLAGILLGVLKPSSGEVLISNGQTSIPVGVSTRENFMYVPQGNSLLSGTIRDNLLIACPTATDEQLADVLHTAGADFVFDLPLGLETECSESGRGLSEGQCQRIAIARALLREGGILILDESTSALDPATEMTVLDRLHERYYESKTIICITHRMAVADLADKIIDL